MKNEPHFGSSQKKFEDRAISITTTVTLHIARYSAKCVASRSIR